MYYTNPHLLDARRGLWDFLLWQMGFYDSKAENEIPTGFEYPTPKKLFEEDKPFALWVGHSTYLIKVGNLHILTDPVWDDYCSPIPIPALKRLSPPPLTLEELPPIDLVLISHNHYDHLDAKTVCALKILQPQIQWIVPKGLAPWFKRRGIEVLSELGWWQRYRDKNFEVTATPTQHFSGRSLFDRNRTLWNGYVFETDGKRFYFVGDTGYNPFDFKAIGERFSFMDLSLIPIGTYVPEIFMNPVHIGPKEAVLIHQEVGSRLSLGMHWNTFKLSDEPQDMPPYDLFLAMQKHRLRPETFLPLEIGAKVNW